MYIYVVSLNAVHNGMNSFFWADNLFLNKLKSLGVLASFDIVVSGRRLFIEMMMSIDAKVGLIYTFWYSLSSTGSILE
jgi:hypothetical protein